MIRLSDIPQKRKHLLFLICFMALFNAILLGVRIYMAQKPIFLFLIWNLFLAFIPLGIGLFLRYGTSGGKNRFLHILLFMGWLLFLPNAFYLMTDLFHLKPRTGIPLWYDLLLIFSFAWNGLIVGYLSIIDIHEFLERTWNASIAWGSSICILILCAFGIYLGRYLRWNSWDILTDPISLISDIGHRVVFPAEHLDAWGVTICYSLFFIIGFITLRIFSKPEISKA